MKILGSRVLHRIVDDLRTRQVNRELLERLVHLHALHHVQIARNVVRIESIERLDELKQG